MTISEIEHNLTQCRWDWCTRNFNTNAEMRDHVLQDHIAHAQPVRRGDVPILRRAEGDSIRLSWVEWSASALSSQDHIDVSLKVPKEQRTYVEKAAVAADNIDDPSLLRTEDDNPDPNHFPNTITSEAILLGSHSMTEPKENNMTRPSQHATVTPLSASTSQSRSRSHPASQVSPSQTQPSPSPIVPLSFTALRTGLPPSPFGQRNAPPMHSSSPSSVNMNMDQDVQGAFKPQLAAGNSQLDTSYNAALDSQWRAQSQLSLGSFDLTASQWQTSGGSGSLEEVKPPASHSTLDVTELSDSSAAKWASRNKDVTSSPSSQSLSQSPLTRMSHSQDLGIGYGDNRATTPLQTQAPLRESYSWSSLT